jgi:TetR/AcrR family transcriptional regulator, regulator of cefoperazone and chloramphenicol sensitivity
VRSNRDLTAAALIRESAMRLFAESGAAAVTVRDIAADAGVSPSLVIHHYGTKDALKDAVDDHVVQFFSDMIAEFVELSAQDLAAVSTSSTLAARLGNGPILPYSRRLLADGGPAAERLFRSLYDMSRAMVRRYEQAGAFKPSSDEAVRVAVLLVNDLGVVLLRDQISAVIGVDPLGPDGLVRWSQAVLELYSDGLMTTPGEDPCR